jgi:hypothetical protein
MVVGKTNPTIFYYINRWVKEQSQYFGCRARNRTWVKGFKVLRATSTQRGNLLFTGLPVPKVGVEPTRESPLNSF